MKLLTIAPDDNIVHWLAALCDMQPTYQLTRCRNLEEALLALVVDPAFVGKQIAESASKAIRQGGLGQVPPSPPRKFDLYLITGTARKMGIHLPDEFVRTAKRVYP